MSPFTFFSSLTVEHTTVWERQCGVLRLISEKRKFKWGKNVSLLRMFDLLCCHAAVRGWSSGVRNSLGVVLHRTNWNGWVLDFFKKLNATYSESEGVNHFLLSMRNVFSEYVSDDFTRYCVTSCFLLAAAVMEVGQQHKGFLYVSAVRYMTHSAVVTVVCTSRGKCVVKMVLNEDLFPLSFTSYNHVM